MSSCRHDLSVISHLQDASVFLDFLCQGSKRLLFVCPGAKLDECPDVARLLARGLGYVCLKHLTPYFNPDNYRKETRDYFESANGPSLSYMVHGIVHCLLPPLFAAAI